MRFHGSTQPDLLASHTPWPLLPDLLGSSAGLEAGIWPGLRNMPGDQDAVPEAVPLLPSWTFPLRSRFNLCSPRVRASSAGHTGTTLSGDIRK